MDESLISEMLEATADEQVARNTRKDVRTIRGIRGTPHAEVAKVANWAWTESRPVLSEEDSLRRLFMSSWEDGLVAIGLLAALVPDGPAEVLEIGLDWLDRVDDGATADALGWLVLGPGLAGSGPDPARLAELIAPRRKHDHPAVRRALVAMGLAFLPMPIQGPSAAPLRARLGVQVVQFVDAPLSPLVGVICHAFLRDESPTVRKAMRRLIREWVRVDPAAVVAWEGEVRGGLPKLLSAETIRARRKAG